MDIKELNKQLLAKRKLNPENTKQATPMGNIYEQCMQRAKEAPKVAPKSNDDEYKSLFNSDSFHLPSRFRNADLKDFGFTDKILLRYFQDNIFKKALKMGKGFVLCGSYGKGKTHFAYAFAKEYIKAHANYEKTKSRYPFIIDFQEIQNNLHGEDKNKFIDKCIKSSLLIIDDFMSIDFTAWEMGQLTHIFNKRYNFMNPVVLTTNLSPKELQEKCGFRLWERVTASNYLKEVSGKSRRSEFDNFGSLNELHYRA